MRNDPDPEQVGLAIKQIMQETGFGVLKAADLLFAQMATGVTVSAVSLLLSNYAELRPESSSGAIEAGDPYTWPHMGDPSLNGPQSAS